MQATVDIASKLAAINLGGLPMCCWPDVELVNELATAIAQKVKAGITKPHIFADLENWLSAYARNGRGDDDDGESISHCCTACVCLRSCPRAEGLVQKGSTSCIPYNCTAG